MSYNYLVSCLPSIFVPLVGSLFLAITSSKNETQSVYALSLEMKLPCTFLRYDRLCNNLTTRDFTHCYFYPSCQFSNPTIFSNSVHIFEPDHYFYHEYLHVTQATFLTRPPISNPTQIFLHGHIF